MFEEKNQGVVAAFANCHAGDVSGNMQIKKSNLKTSNSGYQERMEKFGKAQYHAAQKIFDTATKKVTGKLRFRFQRVDMSNYELVKDRKKVKTAKSGLGYSFAAGMQLVEGVITGTCLALVLSNCGGHFFATSRQYRRWLSQS